MHVLPDFCPTHQGANLCRADVTTPLLTRKGALVDGIKFTITDCAATTLEDANFAALGEVIAGDIGPVSLVDVRLPIVRRVGDERFHFEP